MSAKDCGPRPQRDRQAALTADLRASFRWRGDRTDNRFVADPTGWRADGSILGRLGTALADLFHDASPTLVLGPQSREMLVGALVATQLECGLLEMRKSPRPGSDSDRWLIVRTPLDYKNRNLSVGVRREHIAASHRVLFVDDWIDTGGQARAARTLVQHAGATWCGAAVLIDALRDSSLRRDLQVRSLLHSRPQLSHRTPRPDVSPTSTKKGRDRVLPWLAAHPLAAHDPSLTSYVHPQSALPRGSQHVRAFALAAKMAR